MNKPKPLHPRNRNRTRYDFEELCKSVPELEAFLTVTKTTHKSLDFSDPDAVKTLNRAILKHHYGIPYWNLPEGYLCPPIPGRADMIHYLADLLAESHGGKVPTGKDIRVLDVGTGANCVYPLIGHAEYGWSFVGSDIDETALQAAQHVITGNPAIAPHIELRRQPDKNTIFHNIIQPGEFFHLTMSNPPFHDGPEEATRHNQRKWKNLGKKTGKKPVRNFGGQSGELWCEGGELAFIERMIKESKKFKRQVHWFSTLVSKQANLPAIYRLLRKAHPTEFRTIEMAQGQKQSRVVAWSFVIKN